MTTAVRPSKRNTCVGSGGRATARAAYASGVASRSGYAAYSPEPNQTDSDTLDGWGGTLALESSSRSPRHHPIRPDLWPDEWWERIGELPPWVWK